jgi:hypothetical protein
MDGGRRSSLVVEGRAGPGSRGVWWGSAPAAGWVRFHHCAPIGLDAGWLLAHQHGEMASFHFTLLIVLSLTFSLLRGRGSVLVACHASG